jgi:hypothetical protein
MRISSAILVLPTCILSHTSNTSHANLHTHVKHHTLHGTCLLVTNGKPTRPDYFSGLGAAWARPDYAHCATTSVCVETWPLTKWPFTCVFVNCAVSITVIGVGRVFGACLSQSVTTLCVTTLQSVTTLPPRSSPFFYSAASKERNRRVPHPTLPSRLAPRSSARVWVSGVMRPWAPSVCGLKLLVYAAL